MERDDEPFVSGFKKTYPITNHNCEYREGTPTRKETVGGTPTAAGGLPQKGYCMKGMQIGGKIFYTKEDYQKFLMRFYKDPRCCFGRYHVRKIWNYYRSRLVPDDED